MRKILILLFCLVRFTTTFSQSGEPPFELVRENEKEKISIYERWITFPGSNPPIKAREVKGDFFAHSTIAKALALIKDEQKIFKWQSHVSEFKVYATSDTTTWYEYSYHDIPWPVSDQDHFLEYTIQPESTSEKIKIVFRSKVNAALAPVREDASRMQLHGTWTFEKIDETKIKISYTILSKPSHIPRIFTDPVIRSNLMSTIQGYIAVLEGKK
jgi:hypothetical protein